MPSGKRQRQLNRFSAHPTPQKAPPLKKRLTTIPTIDYGAASKRTLFSGKDPAHKEKEALWPKNSKN
jgi:hypothetical protein